MSAAAADGSAAAASSTAPAAAPAPLPSLGPVSESSTAWRYEGWLHSFPLNHATVLDYFKHSDFYDRTCNNEVALMQTMHADSLKYDHTQTHTQLLPRTFFCSLSHLPLCSLND